MTPTTIIFGPQASGKTLKAKEIVGNRKSVWLDRLKLKDLFLFTNVSVTTEVIVLDGLAAKDLKSVKMLMTCKGLTVRRKGYADEHIERPEMIFISNEVKPNLFRERPNLRIIELKGAEVLHPPVQKCDATENIS